MPSADFCSAVRRPRGRLSRLADDTGQISRGKLNRLQCTTAGSTLCVLDGYGLRDTLPARPALAPRIRFLFIGSHLCSTLPSDPASRRQPLRFTNPSPPSGWVEDFHLRAIEHARHTTNPLSREWGERIKEGLPSERIVGVEAQPSGQETPDGRDEPSAPPHDRGHDGPQSVAGDATILRACRGKVQPVFRPLAGSAGSGGRARLSGPSRRERHLVGGTEPDGLRPAVLLWRHARAWRDSGAHFLRSGAAQAAGRAEYRRGGAVPRSRSKPEDPRRADD